MTPEQLTARAIGNIRRELARRGMNQNDLGDLTGLAQPDVSRLMSSDRHGRASSLATLARVADAMSCRLDALTAGTLVPVLGTIAAGPDDTPQAFAPDDVTFFGVPAAHPPGTIGLWVTGLSCTRWGIACGDTVIVEPVDAAREGRFHALRSPGGLHTLKAYFGGEWWQFGPADPTPARFPLPEGTILVGVVAGGRYGDRAYRPDTPAKKPRRK